MSFNKEISVFDSFAQVVGTQDSTPLDNSNWVGIRLLLEVTNVAAGGTLDVKVQELIGSTWADISGASFAQKIANGSASMTIYPSITAVANVKVADFLPRKWRVRAVVAVNTVTYSLSAVYLIAGA